MVQTNLEGVLSECIDLILSGKSVEECLEIHPEAEQIKQLIEFAAGQIETSRSIQPNPEFKKNLHEELLKKMERL